MAKRGTDHGAATRKKGGARRPGRGRPRRASGRQRKQLVIDVSLLDQAMKLTGENQSETVNRALAQMAQNAAILRGVEQMWGAFPDHPDHEGGHRDAR